MRAGATPDRDTWRGLMRVALRVIDSIRPTYGPLDFRLGGGTVLMFRFDHRISKDIDIFMHDAQALSYLTPRLNEAVEKIVDEYQEHANFVKLNLPDGEIDIIVAADVLSGEVRDGLTFEGRMISLDTTAEILAKKLLYRADGFKARDVFDLATVLEHEPQSGMTALRATRSTRAALVRRLVAMSEMSGPTLAEGILATEQGAAILPEMVHAVLRTIERLDRHGIGENGQ